MSGEAGNPSQQELAAPREAGISHLSAFGEGSTSAREELGGGTPAGAELGPPCFSGVVGA